MTDSFTADGTTYHLHRWGDPEAPAILFLHGFPEWGGAWEAVATRLADRFHCIAPDLRGYGLSDKPAGVEAYSVGAMLPDLFALIDHIGAPVNLAAHDWGAALAYVAAAARPDLVRRFAVMNGVHPLPFQVELAKGGAQARASQYMRYLIRPQSSEELAREDFVPLLDFMRGIGSGAWQTEALRTAYRREWSRPGALDAMINWYRASPIAVPLPGETLEITPLDPARLRIRMPHLVIWGEDDQALLPVTRDGVVPLCDDVRIETLPGCDHWLHHQAPDRVAALLGAFF